MPQLGSGRAVLVLPAIMDISAHAIRLADRTSNGPFGSLVFACAGKTRAPNISCSPIAARSVDGFSVKLRFSVKLSRTSRHRSGCVKADTFAKCGNATRQQGSEPRVCGMI